MYNLSMSNVSISSIIPIPPIGSSSATLYLIKSNLFSFFFAELRTVKGADIFISSCYSIQISPTFNSRQKGGEEEAAEGGEN